YSEADATLGGVVTFASSLQGATLTLGGSQLEITQSVAIDASALWDAENDVPGLTLDANEQSRIFNVVGGTTENPVELIGLKIANGSAPHAGGVMIYAGAALKASDCVFVDNKTTNSGGGLYADGWADLENCLFSGNSAATAGGGVYVAATGSLTATGVEVANNSAKRGGGVSVAKNGTLTLSNSTVVNNIASAAGGGGLQLYGQATLTDSTIFGNSSPTYGGGVNVDAVATIVNCEIVGNTAKYGGGIHTDATRGVLTLTDSTVADNVATSQGGGLAGGGSETIENVVFSENLASQGGGIYASGALTATGLTIFGNTATDGGGLYVAGTGAATLADSTISNNAAGETGQGGGLYVVGTGTATLADSTISDNTAAWGGGGIVWGTATLTNALVVENTATTSGGGFYVDGTATFRNATIAANEAAGGGGLQVSNDGTTTLYNAIVATNAVSNSNYLHTNDVSDSGTFAAYNTLSSFTSWDAGSNNFVYNVAQALFADAANGDYRLAPESQALDKGNDAYAVDASGVALQTDLAGNARFVGTVDLGAYEREPAPQLSSPSLSVSGSSSSSLTLSVGSVDKASSYELQYSTSEDFATSTTLSVSSGDVVVDGLSPNATYYFRAKVLGDGLTGLDSEWSPVVSATTERVALSEVALTLDASALEVGTTLTATVEPSSAEVEWRWFRVDGEGIATEISGATTSSYVASLSDVGYFLRVEATGANAYAGTVSSTTSVRVASLPTAPSTPGAIALSYDAESRLLTMTWGASEDVVNYRVETAYGFDPADGDFWLSQKPGADVTTRSVKIGSSQPYTFRVRAENAIGVSAWVYASFQAPVALSVPDLSVSSTGSSSLTLTVGAVEKAASYELQ
ncbi:MAG: hypothetical protein IJN32_03190, partial [Thermoguttaceae bacterium]|nr:hypothetical protein [Thermoguttaceae bacterium]